MSLVVSVFNIYRTSPPEATQDGRPLSPPVDGGDLQSSSQGFENECTIKVEFRKTTQQFCYCKNPLKLELKRMVLMGNAPSEEPRSNTCIFGLGTDICKEDSILIEFFRTDVNFFKRKK